MKSSDYSFDTVECHSVEEMSLIDIVFFSAFGIVLHRIKAFFESLSKGN